MPMEDAVFEVEAKLVVNYINHRACTDQKLDTKPMIEERKMRTITILFINAWEDQNSYYLQ